MPVITWAWIQNVYFLEVGLTDADKGRELGVDLPGPRYHIREQWWRLSQSPIVACCHLVHFNIII